jgi:hypothetical protein
MAPPLSIASFQSFSNDPYFPCRAREPNVRWKKQTLTRHSVQYLPPCVADSARRMTSKKQAILPTKPVSCPVQVHVKSTEIFSGRPLPLLTLARQGGLIHVVRAIVAVTVTVTVLVYLHEHACLALQIRVYRVPVPKVAFVHVCDWW